MPWAARLLLLVLVLGTTGAQENPGGSPACPCINPWPEPDTGQKCRKVTFNRQHHHSVKEARTECVPLDYGAAKCRAWDDEKDHSKVCKGETKPDWCGSRWCYVNATMCRRPIDPSDLVGAKELHYSYETCGNLNDYSEDRHVKMMRGKTLRVTMPGDSGSGYTIVTLKDQGGALCPKGKCTWNTATAPRTGSVVEFAREICKEAGIGWKRVPIGKDSLAAGGGSSFTACAHMVALNETDLCIGNLWVTTQRMLIHPSFTSIVYSDQMRLVVRVTGAADGWDKFWAPLAKTFSPGAWLIIAFTIVSSSLAMVVVEGGAVGDGTDQVLALLDTQEESRKDSGGKLQSKSSKESAVVNLKTYSELHTTPTPRSSGAA